MIIDSIVGNVSVTDVADIFVKFGYRSANNGTYWSAYRAIADEFNIEYKETSNFETMLNKLRNNNYIICSVGNGLFTTGRTLHCNICSEQRYIKNIRPVFV